jgi:hypothetical protein
MRQLILLVVLSILSLISLAVLVIALTDIYPVEKLTENRTVAGLVFLLFGGFTRQAWQKYKNPQKISNK